MTRILIDLDGVIADWGAEWNRMCGYFGAAAAHLPRHENQRTFNLNEGRTDAEKRVIAAIMGTPGFYAKLTPISGARKALREMRDAGHDIRIVTSPWISNPTCASDKLNWVKAELGQWFAERTIITTDKTLIPGDFLIDDKPSISGIDTPVWEHILFDQPYNRQVGDRRRIVDWAGWRFVIEDGYHIGKSLDMAAMLNVPAGSKACA